MSPAALLAKLCREIKVLREFRPLQLGIDLPARGATPELARRALIVHCGSRPYLEAVAAGGSRFGLDGAECGQVSRLQCEAALSRLKAIAKADRRRAKRRPA